MVLQLTSACGSHVGNVRQNHEDNFCFNGSTLPMENQGLGGISTATFPLNQPCCFGVFDGMGGVEYGEVASFLAADTLKNKLPELSRCDDPHAFLLEACEDMNLAVCRSAERLTAGRMGTTAAMALCHQGRLHACNLGDSRIYRLRRGELTQLSLDHVETFPPGMKTRRKPRLTQHLGIRPSEMALSPHVVTSDLEKDDRYLLCSDGLTDMLSPQEIRSILCRHDSIQDAVSQLMDEALGHGGRDNITLIVIAVR